MFNQGNHLQWDVMDNGMILKRLGFRNKSWHKGNKIM